MDSDEEKVQILDTIRDQARQLGRSPSRSEFRARLGLSEYRILKYFPSWREAVRAAGVQPHSTNIRLDDAKLLTDWGEFVRKHRQIPTRDQYRREGSYSAGSFEKHFGPWSPIPQRFREFAANRTEWGDVVALLPSVVPNTRAPQTVANDRSYKSTSDTWRDADVQHTKLTDRATYGNPMDFRGLRHEPVNEQGVVFLFGMVARELGYMVEAVQTGFPDCEAKRQVAPGRWQRVRIEFEFESRNYRDHGHPSDGCDIIVCWRHNWSECPVRIEVLELSTVIKTLAKSED